VKIALNLVAKMTNTLLPVSVSVLLMSANLICVLPR
jgi:hypothetical protein